MMRSLIVTGAGLLAMTVSGCSWVQLQEGADNVVSVSQAQVAECEQLGRTRVQVAEKIGFLRRNEEAVQENLTDMARNQAVDMGGDTISPLNESEEGRQEFGIYSCRS